MQTLQIPDFIPELPNCADGYHWEYQGEKWAGEGVLSIYYDRPSKEWVNVSKTVEDILPSWYGGCDGFYYFEMVKNEETTVPLKKEESTITFKFMLWKDWVEDIEKRIINKIKSNDLAFEVADVLFASKLDNEDIVPFCTDTMFDDMYISNVMVKYKGNRGNNNYYWWVDGDNTTLIHKED